MAKIRISAEELAYLIHKTEGTNRVVNVSFGPSGAWFDSAGNSLMMQLLIDRKRELADQASQEG